VQKGFVHSAFSLINDFKGGRDERRNDGTSLQHGHIAGPHFYTHDFRGMASQGYWNSSIHGQGAWNEKDGRLSGQYSSFDLWLGPTQDLMK